MERKLGVGGMGEVYLARDEKLNRLVAIKLLTATDDVARRRLAREARAAASLDHPGICAVYEVGTDAAAGDFIAMQYIEGETLAARLRRGRMAPDEAMSIGAQIAEALVAAHKHGLVHRDLKPQNVILTPSGSARLLDFGLAQHVPSTMEAANAVTSSRVTDPQTVLGTPGYMSPEQVRNEPADFRTDVFALGCVIYECLTGHRAFTGATTAEVLGNILHVDPPPVSSIVPHVGPAYDALCARMLYKTPSERFHSAEEALGAIRALTPTSRFSTASLRVTPPRPRRMLRLAIAVTVIVAGFLGWQWYKQSALPVSALPVPPAEAEGWYLKGVEAMRDGAFLGARTAFERAIHLFSGYAQAYSRLAEADTALDDEAAATTAMTEAGRLGPNRTLWPKEEQVRYEAASGVSVRQYAAAIDAYQRLVDMKPDDAGRWLDLGRAQETSPITPRAVALASYQKAVDLDKEYAAARLRLGVMQIRNGNSEAGLASIDKAIELYRAGQSPEGEAEAQLRKGIALVEARAKEPARASLTEVLQLAGGQRFPAHRIRAQFSLARLAYNDGQFTEAENLAQQAVAAAASGPSDLRVLSATGLIELGLAMMARGGYDEANAQFVKAIALAKDRGATRVEMRAKSQLAALKELTGEHAEALKLVEEPYQHFLTTEDAKLLADTQLVLSRAHEGLEHYPEARKFAEEALRFADSAKDNSTRGNALECLAGQTTKLGDLPAAARYRAQIVELHRDRPDTLPKDLTNEAELLILLGKKPAALALLAEVERGIAARIPSYVERTARVAQLGALLAVTEQRWTDVIRFAEAADAVAPKPPTGGAPTTPARKPFAGVLAEYALAKLGRSRTPVETIAQWPPQSTDAATRRDRAYFVALTLLARGKPDLAQTLALETLSAPGIRGNTEQGWRLAAVATLAARQLSPSARTTLPVNQKNTTFSELEKAWTPADATAYFARPDLNALRNAVR